MKSFNLGMRIRPQNAAQATNLEGFADPDHAHSLSPRTGAELKVQHLGAKTGSIVPSIHVQSEELNGSAQVQVSYLSGVATNRFQPLNQQVRMSESHRPQMGTSQNLKTLKFVLEKGDENSKNKARRASLAADQSAKNSPLDEEEMMRRSASSWNGEGAIVPGAQTPGTNIPILDFGFDS